MQEELESVMKPQVVEEEIIAPKAIQLAQFDDLSSVNHQAEGKSIVDFDDDFDDNLSRSGLEE